MRLKKQEESNSKQLYRRKKKLLIRIFVFCFIVALLLGAWMLGNVLKKKGYSGLFDFTITVISNYRESFDAHPEKISIKISDKDFKKLEKNRKQALERGVIINDIDGDYVPAVIEYNGRKINVKMRLKGHMTDHLQDNKWSFRIKMKEKDETFMGMKRFSIQHPGTRGYIYEWIYHELMKREDVIALRYKFIDVSVNGRDWGIYAVEENFENELIENNKRLKGPILRFNPDLYWVNRYNDMTKTASADEFASYYSANPEAYREDKVLADTVQKKYYLKGIALIEGLRSKKIPVDIAFDIPRLAKFHAVIDLVGGIHSIDWSDIKYYYNPVTGKLEPVAYESFTELQSRYLSSQYKFVSIDSSENYSDWHSMIFSNIYFFKEYVKNLERIIKPEYLDSFFEKSNEELKSNLAIINKEFPYKKFDKSDYYNRQKMISKILDPPKAIHAYFKEADNNTMIVQIGAIDALPVQIYSIDWGSMNLKPDSELIIPGKQVNEYVKFKEYKFGAAKQLVLKKEKQDSMKINYSILGSSEIKRIIIFPYPHTDSEFISDDLKNKKGNFKDFSFLSVDEESKLIQIKSGYHVVNRDIIIPPGYKLIANESVSLDFRNNSKIISYSSVLFEGNEDNHIMIGSSDSTGQGILIIGANLGSKFNNVTFKNLPEIEDKQWHRSGSLTFYESPVEFKNCSFYNSKGEDAVSIIRSAFSFKECLFQKIGNDALDCDYSDGSVSNCVFEFCKENALDITMGKITIQSVYITNSWNKAINLKAGAQMKGSDLKIKNSNIAISAEDLSSLELKKVNISDSNVGLLAYKNKPAGGQPEIRINDLEMKNVTKKYLREKRSVILVNGIGQGEVIDNAETFIKSEKNKQK